MTYIQPKIIVLHKLPRYSKGFLLYHNNKVCDSIFVVRATDMRNFIIVLLVVLLPGLLAGCSPSFDKKVSLRNVEQAVVTTSDAKDSIMPLRVAVSSILSPKETLTVYQPLLQYLQNELGYSVVLLQRKTYKEVNDLLEAGNADVAFVCSGGYVAGSQVFGMELLAMPQVGGEQTYQSVIITGKETPASSLVDLQHRSFAFTDPMSFSGRIAPVYMLESRGFMSQQFFGRTFFTYSHDAAIKAVYDGIVDAAAVDSLIFTQAVAQNQDIAARVKIIDRSLSVGTPPVVVKPGTDRELTARLQVLLLTMHQHEAGRNALAALHYDKFVAPDETLYAPLKNIWLTIREKL